LVFQNKKFEAYLNSQFVAIELVNNERQGKELRERFHVPGNPVIILLDNSGEEIDRIIGFGNDTDAFVQTVKDYSAGRGVLAALQKQYQEDTLDVNYNYALAQKYSDRFENDKAVRYYRNVLKLDLRNENGFGEVCRYQIAVREIWHENDNAPLLDFLQHSSNQDLLSKGYANLIDYFSSKKDTVRLYETFEKAVAALPQNSRFMNQYAWSIYEDRIKAKYDRGIELAQKALELEPEAAHIWDTLAWLLFENGDKKGAIEAMQKAVKLEPDTEGFRKNLKKMQESN
jgi:tetratricopeptide (TPR) repeat protein